MLENGERRRRNAFRRTTSGRFTNRHCTQSSLDIRQAWRFTWFGSFPAWHGWEYCIGRGDSRGRDWSGAVMGRRTRKGHMPLRPLRIGPPSGECVCTSMTVRLHGGRGGGWFMGRTRRARRRTAFKDIKRRARPDTRRIKQPNRNTQFAPPRPPRSPRLERKDVAASIPLAGTLTQNTTHHRQASHPESCRRRKLLEQISPPFHDRPRLAFAADPSQSWICRLRNEYKYQSTTAPGSSFVCVAATRERWGEDPGWGWCDRPRAIMR